MILLYDAAKRNVVIISGRKSAGETGVLFSYDFWNAAKTILYRLIKTEASGKGQKTIFTRKYIKLIMRLCVF